MSMFVPWIHAVCLQHVYWLCLLLVLYYLDTDGIVLFFQQETLLSLVYPAVSVPGSHVAAILTLLLADIPTRRKQLWDLYQVLQEHTEKYLYDITSALP